MCSRMTGISSKRVFTLYFVAEFRSEISAHIGAQIVVNRVVLPPYFIRRTIRELRAAERGFCSIFFVRNR
jgi:hypothetical protein